MAGFKDLSVKFVEHPYGVCWSISDEERSG